MSGLVDPRPARSAHDFAPPPDDELRRLDDGWAPASEALEILMARSFVSADRQSQRLRVFYAFREHDLAVVGRCWFGPEAEGPPRHAHGGAMAALLDELMGFSAWLVGHRVLAKDIQVGFRRPLPLGTMVQLLGQVERVDGRQVHVRGQLLGAPTGASPTLYAESTGVFVDVGSERFAKMLSGPQMP